MNWTENLVTMQNDLYSSSTSWDWQRVAYEIGETQSQLRNNEPGFQKLFFVSHSPYGLSWTVQLLDSNRPTMISYETSPRKFQP